MLIPLGLVIGFVASVPPGPINLLAMSLALKHGFWRSLEVGMTAALLDIVYCYIAMTGASIVSSLLNRWAQALRLISALILLGVAWVLLRQAGSTSLERYRLSAPPSRSRLVPLTLFLYVSSPTLAAFWISVAASITAHGLAASRGIKPFMFALSCGAGSLIWYLGVAKYGSKLQSLLSPKLFKIILTALALTLFGIAFLALGRFLLG